MAYRWRINCSIHGYQFEWADEQPLDCPLVESDPIAPGGDATIVGKEAVSVAASPTITETDSSDYLRICSVYVDTGETTGPISRVKVLSSMDEGITSYDVELYNRDTHETVIEKTFTNTGDVVLSDLGLLPIPLEGILNLEVNVKKNGVSSEKYVRVEKVLLFSRQEF